MLFIYCPWFTFLSLSFRFVTSLPSLGTLLTRSHLRFTPRRGLPLGRVRSCLASLHSSFASLRTPIDLSLCLHPPGSLPLLLQSAVHYLYFLSSRGFSFLRLVLGLRLAFAVHPASLFATSLEGLPFIPSCSLPSCGSSWVFYPFGGPSPPPPSVLCCFSWCLVEVCGHAS